jgi:Arc/MetJ family transcription regulator
MARTTVVIDDKLLDEARAALGTKGIRETVEASLRETVRKRRLAEFREALGTIEMDMTLEELLRLRHEQ